MIQEGLLLGGSSGINIAGAHPPGPRARPRPHDRDAALRFRRALRLQAVQSGFSALQEPAGPGLARGEGDSAQGVRLMTEALFRDDCLSGRDEGQCRVRRSTGDRARPNGLLPAGRRPERAIRACFILDGGRPIAVVNTVYDADRKTILHVPAEGAALPPPARGVVARIDWDLRFKRMRAHTALHLLSVVLPYPVTGGSVGDAEGRLDFDSGEARPRQGGGRAQAQRAHRARRAGEPALDRRRGARGQSGAGQDHVGQAADGNRPRPARSRSRASTSSPAGEPMSRAPAKSAAPR